MQNSNDPNAELNPDEATPESTTPPSATAKSRREFLADATVLGVGVTLATAAAEGEPATASPLVPQAQTLPATTVSTTLQINGKAYPMQIETRVSLLDAIRENAQLTGSKKGL